MIRELQGTQDYSPSVRRFLQQHGEETILQMQVIRKPVMSAITGVLNIISLGAFNKQAKKYGYDKFFHLGLMVKLSNGGYFRIEKLSQIAVSPWKIDGEAYLMVNIPQKMTISHFLNRGRQDVGDQTWFTYDAFSNNCQQFVATMLKANDLYLPHIQEFVMQPVDELVKKLPAYTSWLARKATDLGSIAERVIYGAGLRSAHGVVLSTLKSLQ